MNTVIDLAFSRRRTILLSLLFILGAGALAYSSIPKESEPDIAVPIIYVSMTHDGISPEDAERLLVRPMERELQSVEGLKEMKSTAGEGSTPSISPLLYSQPSSSQLPGCCSDCSLPGNPLAW